MKRMLSYMRVMRLAGEMAMRHAATDGFVVFSVFIQPLIIALLGLFMLQDHGGDYGIFVVVGSGLTGLWSSLLFVSGSAITQERWTGTLEGLVGVPTPMWVVVLGKNLAHVVQSMGSMVLAYALASLMFGYPLSIGQPGLFALSCLFILFSFVCFGLLLSPLFVVNADAHNFRNGLEFPVFILSGFLFPIALLPGWTTPLSYILAPYWAARALHTTSIGQATFGSLMVDWGIMLALGIVYLLISAWLFKVVLDKARRDATLGFQ